MRHASNTDSLCADAVEVYGFGCEMRGVASVDALTSLTALISAKAACEKTWLEISSQTKMPIALRFLRFG
jgi:hypothetical protein